MLVVTGAGAGAGGGTGGAAGALGGTAFVGVASGAGVGAGVCATGAGCGAFQLGPDSALSGNGSISEQDAGGWLQADWDAMFYGLPFRGNIGGRYVATSSAALGYNFPSARKT